MSWKQDWMQTGGEASEEDKLKKRFPLPEPSTIIYYYLQQPKEIVKLGKRLSIRQVALATAQVYVLRFYSRVDIRKTNPFLILTTAFYLACKTEECHLHIRMVATESRNFWPEYVQAVDTSVIGECEFVLIQELDAQLIVNHPYADLMEIKDELGLTQDETTLAWQAINDAHATSMILTSTPRTIAAAATSLVVSVRPSSGGQPMSNPVNTLFQGGIHGSGEKQRQSPSKQQKLVMWLAHSGLKLEAVVECTQALISLYAALEKYSEADCKQKLGALAKARGITGA